MGIERFSELTKKIAADGAKVSFGSSTTSAPNAKIFTVPADGSPLKGLQNLTKLTFPQIKVPSPPPVPRALPEEPLPPSPLHPPLEPLGVVTEIRSAAGVLVQSVATPQLVSRKSAVSPFQTLYNDFSLVAEPVYNFWVDDEETNEREEKGDRSLEDVPRYVRVRWRPAPVLPGIEKLSSKSVVFGSFRSTKLGNALRSFSSFHSSGIDSSLEHLTPEGFSLAVHSLADPYLAPGVICGAVHIPASDVELLSGKKSVSFDESSFLTDPTFKGISPHEVLTNSSLGKEVLKSKSLVPSVRVPKTKTERVPEPDADRLLGRVSSAVSPSSDEVVPKNIRFFDTSISAERVLFSGSPAPHHLEAALALSTFSSHVSSIAQSGLRDRFFPSEIPSFPSPPGLPPVEYVGYVLEKYRLSDSGAFELFEEIEIPSREVDEYVDTKVAYGRTYRYRIRSIVRWTRPSDLGPMGRDNLVVDTFASQTKSRAPFLSSYFGSHWSLDWAYTAVVDLVPPLPPEEISVVPLSAKGFIVVTGRFPENTQRDISSFKLFRKVQDGSGTDLTGWELLEEFGPKNFLYADRDVSFFESSGRQYVYAAVSLSRHNEVSSLSEQVRARLSDQHESQGELPVEQVSCPGVRLGAIGAFSVSPPARKVSEVIVPPVRSGSGQVSSFVLSGRASRGKGESLGRNYVVKVVSLDTGEVRFFPLATTFTNVPKKNDFLKHVISSGPFGSLVGDVSQFIKVL